VTQMSEDPILADAINLSDLSALHVKAPLPAKHQGCM